MLSDIEVLDKPDDNYWTAKAYLIPDTPMASVKPGETGVKMVPISRMVPRSFFTNVLSGDSIAADAPVSLRGIAFGGDTGVKSTDLSLDGGMTWLPARLGKDEGKYSFRRWEASLELPRGRHNVLVRCTNSNGEMQPLAANWNPSGFMRNAIETVSLFATHGDR